MPRTYSTCLALASALMLLVGSYSASASDWTRFRGPGGSGQAPDDAPTPTTWSEEENLKWAIDLPGPGLSCPILVGDKVLVTCWTGYAAGEGSSDDIKDLKRALVCVDRESGDVVWQKTVDAVQPEEEFRGMFAENGYASHTPVSDGENVYVFYGKSGVLAYDLQGNKLWHKSVGDGEGMMGWGTASSPILYDDLLVVTAAAESKSLVAFNKATGDEVWRQEADSLEGTWSTPILVEADGQTDMVLSVPYEVWGLNPQTGKLRWFCQANESNSACASPVAKDGVVYMLGGRDGNAIAIRAGGKGDVGESSVVWRERRSGRIGSPVIDGEYLYWIANGQANCIRLSDASEVYRERLSNSGGGGRGRGQDYASCVAADGKLYYINRGGTTFVIKLGPEFEQLATNQFASDDGDFNATPAIADGQIFIRSTKKLYCVE